jgi:hypothetical protein
MHDGSHWNEDATITRQHFELKDDRNRTTLPPGDTINDLGSFSYSAVSLPPASWFIIISTNYNLMIVRPNTLLIVGYKEIDLIFPLQSQNPNIVGRTMPVDVLSGDSIFFCGVVCGPKLKSDCRFSEFGSLLGLISMKTSNIRRVPNG